MHKKIAELSYDPFSVVLDGRILGLVVDSRTGDILMGSAVLHAWKGLAFSLAPGPAEQMLKLQYRDITIDMGFVDDATDAAAWVESANRFLAGKKTAAAPNERFVPPLTSLDLEANLRSRKSG